MEKITDTLNYKMQDIQENINLLNKSDLTDRDREVILKDLPSQAQELKDTINKYIKTKREIPQEITTLKKAFNGYDPFYIDNNNSNEPTDKDIITALTKYITSLPITTEDKKTFLQYIEDINGGTINNDEFNASESALIYVIKNILNSI